MIPKIIHQTWISKDENESIDKLRSTWIELNPEFVYKYYDDADILEYLKNHFDERIQLAYNRILNGSMKADFFRYCVLYHEGGLYIDIDISCLKPLVKVFNFQDFHVVTATDYCRVQRTDRIYQGFLGAEPQSMLFMNMLLFICDSMDKNLYKYNLFTLCGPIAFSTQLKQYMNRNITTPSKRCSFLKELYFTNIHHKEHYGIITHDISKETLVIKDNVFGKAQHKFDRGNELHYFKHKSKYTNGYYI